MTYRISRHFRVHDYFSKQFAAKCFPVVLAGIYTFSPIAMAGVHVCLMDIYNLIWLSDTVNTHPIIIIISNRLYTRTGRAVIIISISIIIISIIIISIIVDWQSQY